MCCSRCVLHAVCACARARASGTLRSSTALPQTPKAPRPRVISSTPRDAVSRPLRSKRLRYIHFLCIASMQSWYACASRLAERLREAIAAARGGSVPHGESARGSVHSLWQQRSLLLWVGPPGVAQRQSTRKSLTQILSDAHPRLQGWGPSLGVLLPPARCHTPSRLYRSDVCVWGGGTFKVLCAGGTVRYAARARLLRCLLQKTLCLLDDPHTARLAIPIVGVCACMGVWVWVCVCGCVCVWVCVCVGVWVCVCGCVGVWVCGCGCVGVGVGVWVWVGVWRCGCVGVWVWVWVCGCVCVWVWVCGCVGVGVWVWVGVWRCGCVGVGGGVQAHSV